MQSVIHVSKFHLCWVWACHYSGIEISIWLHFFVRGSFLKILFCVFCLKIQIFRNKLIYFENFYFFKIKFPNYFFFIFTFKLFTILSILENVWKQNLKIKKSKNMKTIKFTTSFFWATWEKFLVIETIMIWNATTFEVFFYHRTSFWLSIRIGWWGNCYFHLAPKFLVGIFFEIFLIFFGNMKFRNEIKK